MTDDVQCPIDGCGESVSKRGLHGHIQHGHDVPASKALDLAANAKGHDAEASEQSGTEAGETARDTTQKADAGDDVDRTIDDILRRIEQRERVQTVKQLTEDADDGQDRSPVDDVERVVSVLEKARKLTGDDGGLSPDDVRRIVREETARETATDGGASDPLAVAVERGAGPDEIEALARATGRRNDKKWQILDKAIERLSGSPNAVAELAGVAADVLASRRQRPPRRPRVEPEETPASEPADDDGNLASEERLERIREATDNEPENDDAT